MHRPKHTTTLMAVLCVAGLLAAGCETLPGRGGETSRIDTEVVAPPEAVVNAAKQAIQQHEGLVLISSRASALDGHVTGRTARDESVDVFVNSRTDRVTHLRVRVGGSQNQSIALDILDRIRQQVGGGQGTNQRRQRSGQDQQRRMGDRRQSVPNEPGSPDGGNGEENPALLK